MHPIRVQREARGWSQAELAHHSGVRRATISAIETGRVVPSVHIALQLAQALEHSVERLFEPKPDHLAWAWPPPDGAVRFWAAQVYGRALAYPVEPVLTPYPHDGLGQPWTDLAIGSRDNLRNTVVLASCDPSVPLLAHAMAARGFRLLVLSRPSAVALNLLRQGLVHAAGVHFATSDRPEANREGPQDDLLWLPAMHWEVGVALGSELRRRALVDVVRQPITWINRPLGSGARDSLDRLFAAHRQALGAPAGYEREVRDHFAVGEAVASGLAQAGLTLRMVAQERNLGFRKVETALYEIAVRADKAHDPAIAALRSVLGSGDFGRTLAEVPGMRMG